MLSGLVLSQADAQDAVLHFVSRIVEEAIVPEIDATSGVSHFELHLFGSRAIGTALPSSDMDILGAWKLEAAHHPKMSCPEVLRKIYDMVRLDHRCTEVHDVINHKYT